MHHRLYFAQFLQKFRIVARSPFPEESRTFTKLNALDGKFLNEHFLKARENTKSAVNI